MSGLTGKAVFPVRLQLPVRLLFPVRLEYRFVSYRNFHKLSTDSESGELRLSESVLNL